MADRVARAERIGKIVEAQGFVVKTDILNDTCVMCGSAAKEFRDDLSRREFAISGMCQKCQDETFGGS